MPCYRPLSAYRQLNPETRARTIVFGREHLKNHDIAQPLDLPCGQCIGCRLERSRRWAVRIMHEASLHKRNCFITLTYDEKNLPKNGSLQLEHVQLFLKRLRRGSQIPLRYFLCGEYGEKSARPHYHLCLFGDDFKTPAHLAESDNKYHVTPTGETTPYPILNTEITQPLWKPHSTTPAGHQLYTSERLTETWGMGHVIAGDLTFESAAYVARYCLKKVTGKKHAESYGLYCPWPEKKFRNGEQMQWLEYVKRPEFVLMSRRPGIGKNWLEQWANEVYPSDSVVMRGKQMLPPPYYDKLLERTSPALFERVKKERARGAEKFANSEDSRSRRLMDSETVKNETIKNALRRSV